MILAIMLATGPETANAVTARNLADAASLLGHRVTLFLDHDGVYCAAGFADLTTALISVVGCTFSARQRAVQSVEGVTWGSQLDWAEAVEKADRVVLLA